MSDKIIDIKKEFGNRLLILAHHYQSDDIVKYADVTGDSLKLAQAAASNNTAEYIIFCGVHFMAETADILTSENQLVFMPDTSAGCPMANMADYQQAKKAWDYITKEFSDSIMPITYINSKASVKAFCGKHGGSVVTSSNAKSIVKYGLSQKRIILFLPDQNLGRNTAINLGVSENSIALYNPADEKAEYSGSKDDIRVILWNGYCHAHHNINLESVQHIRKNYPDMKIIVHPECRSEIVKAADFNGSTEFIINTVKASPYGSQWAIGTERNLVGRLKNLFSDKKILLLDSISSCDDMDVTTPVNLLSILQNIKNNNFTNQIKVEQSIAEQAKKALDLMLSLS